MQSATISAPSAHDFNPQKWLADFGEHGGGYYACPDSVQIGWLVADGTSNSQAARMLNALSPDQERAVKAHIIALRDAEPDTVEAAWQRIKNARVVYNLADPDDDDAEELYWSVVDKAERTMQETTERTRRSAEIKLWLAFLHSSVNQPEEALVFTEDLPALLLRERDLDWLPRLLISAIRDLHGEA